jgi:hypothetical protein
MHSLDIHRPGMPDLQFVLFVVALCTSGLPSLNVPEPVRARVFDRCWALLHDGPPPVASTERVLDLRAGTELTLEAMAATIRTTLSEAGCSVLTWDHPPSEPTRDSTPEALPLIERLQRLYPHAPDIADPGPEAEGR